MNIKRLMYNPLQENCYVVSDDTNECVIIDCGAYYDEEKQALAAYIKDNSLKPVHLVATHGHLDHNFGNAFVYSQYGLKVEICAEDQTLLEQLPMHAATLFGMNITEQQPPIGRLLKHGDTITFGNHTLQVLHTPGHSHGSALLYCEEENTVFTGDTLFRMSIGRTDFPESSWAEMEHSLTTVVKQLPKETIVLSGHGPQSTMADELQYNLYLKA
jgi:glyoxylase-like metal-dependent hydrolase (beta-lactamase superfamily II)